MSEKIIYGIISEAVEVSDSTTLFATYANREDRDADFVAMADNVRQQFDPEWNDPIETVEDAECFFCESAGEFPYLYRRVENVLVEKAGENLQHYVALAWQNSLFDGYCNSHSDIKEAEKSLKDVMKSHIRKLAAELQDPDNHELPEEQDAYTRAAYQLDEKLRFARITSYLNGVEIEESGYSFCDLIDSVLADDQVVWELCPHCGDEIELDRIFKAQSCPACGGQILPCSICEDKKCSKCPLEK